MFSIGMDIKEPYAKITIPNFFGDAHKLLMMVVTTIERHQEYTVIHLESYKHYEDRNKKELE